MIKAEENLISILDLYSRTILTDYFHIRIREREIDKHFPFNIHNIYRFFISISDLFYEIYKNAYMSTNLNLFKYQNLLGQPSRVFRYFHVIISGMHKCHGYNFTREDILLLSKLSIPIIKRIQTKSSINISKNELNKINNNISKYTDKKDVIKLAIYLREFVDFLFMGQHDQGFTSFPPIETDIGIVILRKYYNLSSYLPWNAINIYTYYDKSNVTNLRYDYFRSDIEGLPPPQNLLFANVFLPFENRFINTVEIHKLINLIEKQIVMLKKHFDNLSYIDAEKSLGDMFCSELLNLISDLGKDKNYWINQINNRIDKIHHEDNLIHQFNIQDGTEPCYTDIYLHQLKICLSQISEALIDG